MKSPYIQGLKQGFAELSVYSLDFLLSIIQSVGRVAFEVLLWLFVIPVGSQEELLQRAAYFLMTNGIALIIGGARYRFGRELGDSIREGTLSFYLLKPISPVMYLYAEHIGGRGTDLLVGAVFIIMASFWIKGLTLLTGTLLLLMLITALINTVALNVIAGAIGFWSTESGGVKNAIAMVTNLLNGQQIPLPIFMEVLSPFWAQFLYILPFASGAYTPAHLLLVKSAAEIDYRFIISSSLWAIVLPVLATIIWKKGLKRYEGTGG